MRSIRRFLFWVGAITLFAVTLPAADRDPVDQLLDQYLDAYNAGDAGALAALYTEDAVILPHEESGVQGRSKIESFWKRNLRFDAARRMGRRVSVTPVTKRVGSDVAYLVGTFGIGSGDPHNFVLCLVRDHEGSWRIASEMWNFSGPRMVPAV